MRSKPFVVLLLSFALCGCGPLGPGGSSPIIAKVGACEISVKELEEGFSTSAFSTRPDRVQSRREYLDVLINQKLILLDAQEKGLDKTQDFLSSIERFWTQSLLTVALGKKTLELRRGLNVPENDLHRAYDIMVKDGKTTQSFEEVYPQARWRAEKVAETARLEQWMHGLRKKHPVTVDEQALTAFKKAGRSL